MLDFILTACLITQPAICRDHHTLIESDKTPIQCMMVAPPMLAKWFAENPGWSVKSWTCQYPRAEKQI